MELPSQRRRRPTPDHPPYSEMVQCAIRALGEDQGSTESSISAYIRAHYESLPWAHSRLLPYYLHKLLLAGEIRESPLPNRFALPPDPDPDPSTPLNPSPKALQSPSVSPPPDTGPGRSSRPRLILKLKRHKDRENWRWLNLKTKELNGHDNEVSTSALKE
ncbi:uncharacterized protein A4U43_C07F16220 [Asparagus officinalis]|uniref:H15 domain-containing protein n=1 Tax=Asparagus officinalis TaxID=4686 RepID=A0A5P1ECK1_ASPOF|nr:HMG-Y-related protein A-like [Asparagus officinalis]ONK63534.1 uncharacterized protein A4U43_C07F16220 [Asparagus officinalis]